MYLEYVRSLLNCCQKHEETVSTYSKNAARKKNQSSLAIWNSLRGKIQLNTIGDCSVRKNTFGCRSVFRFIYSLHHSVSSLKYIVEMAFRLKQWNSYTARKTKFAEWFYHFKAILCIIPNIKGRKAVFFILSHFLRARIHAVTVQIIQFFVFILNLAFCPVVYILAFLLQAKWLHRY